MTSFQKNALHGGPMPSGFERKGKLKIVLSVFPSDTRPSGWVWGASVSGDGTAAEKKQALLDALSGVGDDKTDFFTNSSRVSYLMRDFTLAEVALRTNNRS